MPAKSAPLFDLQVNGFSGVDFQQDDISLVELERAMQALLFHRTGKILLTLITDSVDNLCRRLEHFERLRKQSSLAQSIIVGYHIEGPWLLPEPGYMGAHPPELMELPSIANFERLSAAAGGHIRLITLAPELPGSPEVIAHCVQQNTVVAIGHSNANDQELDAAIEAGLTLCTHVGNGVPSELHRHTNIMQRLLSRDELTAVFIPDGIHIPPATLRNFVRAKPPGKALFTTDAMAAAGAPPGRYTLGSTSVQVGTDRIVREVGKDNFAGSALTMDSAVSNIENFLGWTAKQALSACSVDVAKALGLSAS